jgi:hypothetical protein
MPAPSGSPMRKRSTRPVPNFSMAKAHLGKIRMSPNRSARLGQEPRWSGGAVAMCQAAAAAARPSGSWGSQPPCGHPTSPFPGPMIGRARGPI